jgi:hypothetical protein
LQIVTSHVGRLMLDRTIWRATRDMLEANPGFENPPFFFHWITERYHATQALGVRRQMDADQVHQQTMGRLLVTLEQGAHHLTRDWFVSMYRDDLWMKELGNRDFDRFAGPGGDTVPSSWFAELRSSLRMKVDPIRVFVNRRVAHIDGRDVTTPLVHEVDEAIDALSAATIDLSLLLNAAGLLSPEPTMQFNWAEGMDLPWWIPA